MHNLASAIGFGFLGAIAGLAWTSVAVSVLRLSHHRELANKITEKVSGFLWLLALGGGTQGNNRHRG